MPVAAFEQFARRFVFQAGSLSNSTAILPPMSSADEADAAFALLDQVRSILGDSNGRVSSLLQRLHSALEGRRDAVDSLRLALQRQTDAQERREAVLAEQISNLNAQVRRADREAARAALQQQQAAPAPTSSSSSALTAGDSALLAEAQSELLRVRKMARVDRDEQQRRHEAELDALKRAAAEREQALELRLAQATQKSAPSGKKSGASEPSLEPSMSTRTPRVVLAYWLGISAHLLDLPLFYCLQTSSIPIVRRLEHSHGRRGRGRGRGH